MENWVLQSKPGYDSVKEASEQRVNSPRNWRFVQFYI